MCGCDAFPLCAQKLKVMFAVGTDGEVSEPLEVGALSCDTVEQVKEKILSTFKAKFGFSYGPPLKELSIGKDPSIGVRGNEALNASHVV